MSDALERKDFAIELKTEGDSEEYLTIAGYGSVFGNVDQHGDIVERGAFAESLKKQMPKMLWQHRADEPIGVWDEVREDENGLFVKGRIFKNISRGRDVAEMIKQGVIEGLSIGYLTKDYTINEGKRQLKEVELWETSVVTFPSNKLSNIYSSKSVEELTIRDLEGVLKDMGFSGTEAKAMASGAWERRERVLREAGAVEPEIDPREVDELKQLLTEIMQSQGAVNE